MQEEEARIIVLVYMGREIKPTTTKEAVAAPSQLTILYYYYLTFSCGITTFII